MTALNNVRFQRCLTPAGAILNPDLITFCDASRKAFGACTYVRWKLTDGKFGVRFVAAKSRVAPLKELTIPSSGVASCRTSESSSEVNSRGNETEDSMNSVHF